ncbi:NAD(+) diphosphatase [Anoxybacterium hadale]|uniref:NAD(+) diphosphatase n=1 Tax=Anoxybacterium hadale TaxID=3408580 RepID=UPI003AFFB0F8
MDTTSQDLYERFHPALGFSKEEDLSASIIFIVEEDRVLLRNENGAADFPRFSDCFVQNPERYDLGYLGTLDGAHCFYMSYDETFIIPNGLEFESLRTVYSKVDEVIGLVASRAVHLAGWSQRTKYCGVCGSPTRKDPAELAKRCTSCKNIIYPRISPAIIIAVVKEDKLLLAHNKNFKQRWYSTLAGFIEPGETVEICAQREVLEEVGVTIKNIRYFGSQPWPFPDSLMIGLIADYESGEVTPDGVEIDDAAFFGADELPEVPGTYSVAGKLINWFVQTRNQG